MAGEVRAIVLAFALAITSLSQVGGCPSSDFSGLSVIPSPAGDLSSTGGAAADAAVNAANPADRSAGSGSDGDSQLGSAAAGAVQNFDDCNVPRQESEWKTTILNLVNQERARTGLGPVARNATLEAQAGQYACEMIHYDFFDHVNPVTRSTLGQRATQFGYGYQVVGENLAAGQTSPEQTFADWMNSPGHRQNILDPRFTELGIAVRAGGDYGFYWVQEFGRPAGLR